MVEHQSKQHEPITLNASRVLWATAAVVAMLAGGLVVSGGVMAWLGQTMAPEETVAPQATWTQPSASAGVEPNQAATMAEMRHRKQRWLSQYRWVESDPPVARIPIDRAIELLAEQDLTIRWNRSEGDQEDAP